MLTADSSMLSQTAARPHSTYHAQQHAHLLTAPGRHDGTRSDRLRGLGRRTRSPPGPHSQLAVSGVGGVRSPVPRNLCTFGLAFALFLAVHPTAKPVAASTLSPATRAARATGSAAAMRRQPFLSLLPPRARGGSARRRHGRDELGR